MCFKCAFLVRSWFLTVTHWVLKKNATFASLIPTLVCFVIRTLTAMTHRVSDGGRCVCADCNLSYVKSRGPYYGGDCTRGSNLGSMCVSDDGCFDGEVCEGKRCGCSNRVRGPPICECNSNIGFYETNGDNVFGGQCVDDDQRCMCHPDCYDNGGLCDGQRCKCIMGFCHYPDPSP